MEHSSRSRKLLWHGHLKKARADLMLQKPKINATLCHYCLSKQLTQTHKSTHNRFMPTDYIDKTLKQPKFYLQSNQLQAKPYFHRKYVCFNISFTTPISAEELS